VNMTRGGRRQHFISTTHALPSAGVDLRAVAHLRHVYNQILEKGKVTRGWPA